MKTTTGLLSKAAFLALAAFVLSPRAQAQVDVVAPGYSVNTYYTNPTSDDIISFDWDASNNLYYMTTGADFAGGIGFWETSGGAPVNLYNNSNNFSGANVVTIGNYTYFNYSDPSGNEFIANYGPLSGSPAISVISTTPNYGIFSHGGNMFITGADNTGTNNIYYSQLGSNGSLLSNPAISLGTTPGSSGPLVFDSAGDLYYAPGYGDSDIYKWSAAEVADAIANPTEDPLSTTGHLWLDYSSLFPTVAGATSMLLAPDGDLLVTLTDFTNPSDLVDFGTNPDGSYDGVDTTILTDGGVLGELREQDGNTYLAADNEIVQVVPEPGSWLLAGAGLIIVFLKRSRKE